HVRVASPTGLKHEARFSDLSSLAAQDVERFRFVELHGLFERGWADLSVALRRLDPRVAALRKRQPASFPSFWSARGSRTPSRATGAAPPAAHPGQSPAFTARDTLTDLQGSTSEEDAEGA